MKIFVLTFAFAALGFSQSFHIIRVIPSGSTPGSVLFCGNATNAATCVTDQANTAGTVINTTGSRIVGTSDNAFLAIDAGGSERLGFTKQSGFIPRLTYGSGNNFELAQSNATDIGAGNTYTVHLALDASTGAPTFTFNSAVTGAVFTQGGAGHVISINVSNASSAVSVSNTSSGAGAVFTSSSGNGVDGTSSSANGVVGSTSTGIGVAGVATGVLGIGGSFSGAGTAGVGVFASGTSLAAHFGTGNVQIDNNLTISGTCTGCSSGVTTFNTRAGAVTLLAADITSAAQDIQTSASPSFAALNISSSAFVDSSRNITANSFSMAGFAFTVIDSSANLAGNSLLLSGITTNSGGQLVCVTGSGLLYKTATVC